jgi:hypothetical protein
MLFLILHRALLLGMVTTTTLGGALHILLVVAIISLIHGFKGGRFRTFRPCSVTFSTADFGLYATSVLSAPP